MCIKGDDEDDRSLQCLEGGGNAFARWKTAHERFQKVKSRQNIPPPHGLVVVAEETPVSPPSHCLPHPDVTASEFEKSHDSRIRSSLTAPVKLGSRRWKVLTTISRRDGDSAPSLKKRITLSRDICRASIGSQCSFRGQDR